MSGTTASTNTSASGGFLLDRPPGPLRSEQLERILQVTVQNLANLPGPLVRPRWQPMPPTQPPPEVTWASVGVQKQEVDDYPQILHDGATWLQGARAPGVDRMQRHATVTVLVTFYGPEAEDAASDLRDNLYVQQQMEMTKPLKLKTVRDLAHAPELINQQWINRADMEIEFRYQIDRVYPVFNLDGADIVFAGAQGGEQVLIEEFEIREVTP